MNWYVGKTGNHQGLVIEETTGRNVAVTYDKKDAPLVAAAPALLKALEDLLDSIAWNRNATPVEELQSDIRAAMNAVAKAKGD